MSGPIARIGPNKLITSDPNFMKRMLRVHSDFIRGPWFDTITVDPLRPNVFSEQNKKTHDHLKYLQSAAVGIPAFCFISFN